MAAAKAGKQPMRFRRRQCLVCYWFDGFFVAHAYPDREPLTLAPFSVEILAAFESWTDPEVAAQANPLFLGAVDSLHEAGLLLAEGTDEAARDEAIASHWGSWVPEASFFHYATTAVAYPQSEAVPASNPELSTLPPTHTLFTEYPAANRMFLPRRPVRFDISFEQVLFERRTCRDFTDAPIALNTFAALLATVFGPVDYINSGTSALFRRTSAAGGSRQELDAYVGVRAVEDVPAGFYHYNVREHSLELLGEGLTSRQITDLCAGQEWAGGMAFFVVLVAMIDRMRSKYAIPRVYRASLINAGHLGQTFAMTATALGLGPFQTAICDDLALCEAFTLDGIGQLPLYLLGAGHPSPAPSLSPPVAELDTMRRTTLTFEP
ncbi:SagB/ThcOx family dehydrogenase [Nocardia sp. CDC160]|uniref:SagB/ThcOx family dehydrogenase n=1 Tax=Nocardia sp. CDC160 TaxID=3112166 RepID=UPI002DB91EB6|nr:SagB/ThcOx family dehydrogenase [Nocardia sp. CDC160]MEC3920293.1 SagB/ThcOx family dehydrogenase [Nocardia sp. CDC160]